MRIALAIEYDGSRYHGWQSQPGLYTVQQVVEKALSTVAATEIKVFCAGRTDTGVHAANQIIHFDTNVERSIRSWIHGGNSFLPKDVCIKWGREMPDEFHARFSAKKRRYIYLIHNAPIRPALIRSNVTWHYKQLSHETMHKAAQNLVGELDFTSFRSIECQSESPMRNVKHIEVRRRGDLVIIDISANAFLHHMVRNIAGVLMAIGSGKKNPEWICEVLLAKDRKMGAETAPPYGLYLYDITYPKEFNIIKMTNSAIFLGAL